MSNKIYIIPMFPYPSGHCHVGHARNYVFSDILSRYYKIVQQEEVVHAFGVDAFGLPAENAANKFNIQARIWTEQNTKHILHVLDKLNINYNHSLWLDTTSKNYIRLNQFIFQILFERGYIYRSLSYQNWDPQDETVLSNEQVINGRGWRSGVMVEKKLLNSWFVKIHQEAEFLKQEIKTQDKWPTQIKKMQNSWIMKVNGHMVIFKFVSDANKYIECFTKQPECIAHARFIAIAYTHPLAIDFILSNNIKIEEHYISDLAIATDIEVINPYNNDVLNVYIAGYTIPYFASQALYGAPDFDLNDAKFADKINIKHKFNENILNKISPVFSIQIIDDLRSSKMVREHVFYSLHDWCISRQRIWGCPIPIIYCDTCGPNILIDDDINAKRLEYIRYSELLDANLNANCSKCQNSAKIDTETLDTFFDSSWYYLNYLHSDTLPYIQNLEEAKTYLIKVLENLPINFYIGGIEHANLHLIYTRAMISILHKCLKLEYKAPIDRLINQGSVLYIANLDSDGQYIDIKDPNHNPIASTRLEKMSKSKFNTVDVDSIVDQYSAEALRFAIMANMPIEVSYEWNQDLVDTKFKFLNKLDYLLSKITFSTNYEFNFDEINDTCFLSLALDAKLKRMFDNYTLYMQEFKIHNAISVIHELYNEIKLSSKEAVPTIEQVLSILLMLYPIAPKLSSKYLELFIPDIKIEKMVYSYTCLE